MASLCTSGIAVAQTADGGDTDDLIVTARKTDESILEVPLAISAVTAEQLEQTGARSLDEVSRLTPGFTFERTIGTLAQPVIRGQAQTRVTNPVQNVATFFNGVYLQRSFQVDSDLLDIERVEVVKGPQSALFGRNAFAGAVSIVTRRPDMENFRGRFEATIGNYDRRELRGSLSVPLGGFAAISVAGSLSDFDGTWRNANTGAAALTGDSLVTKGRLNGYENRSVLAQITIQPSDNISIDGFWSHRDIFIESAATYQLSSTFAISRGNAMNCTPFGTPASPAANGVNALFCGALPVNPPVGAGDPRRAGLLVDRRSYGQDGQSDVAGATVAVDLTDALSLTYQFGYTNADATNVATLSGDPLNGSAFPFFLGQVLFDARGNGTITSKTHELRAQYETSGLRILLGGFAGTVDDFSFGGTAFLAPSSTTDVFANITTPLSGYGATQRDERNRAVFGLVSLELTDGLRVSAEARQSWERVRQQGVTAAGARTGTLFEREFRAFTPRFTVDFQPNDNWLIYASAAKGAKVGGFNVPTATNPLTAAQQVFLPESNWTYELGVKGTLLDRVVTLEAAVFHTDWSNLQGNQSVNLGQPAIIRNLAGANVDGFELTAIIRPTRSLTFNAGLAYANSRFAAGTVDDTIPRALCASLATCPTTGVYSSDISGRSIPRAPELQFNGGVTYRQPIGSMFGSDVDLVSRVDVSVTGRQYTDNTNTAYVPSRELVDANIGLTSDTWSVRLWAKNLFDKQYPAYAFTTFAGSGAGSGVTYGTLLGDRRTIGATVSFNF
jgi:iron complex outermembrane receptor protein